MHLLDKENTLHRQPIKTLGGLVGSWRSAVMDNISPKCRRFDSVPGDVLFLGVVFWIHTLINWSIYPVFDSLVLFYFFFVSFQIPLQNE
ncbi:hypothetical protein CI102_3838 [Trichoderma harzianum]|nr:hypothetical protein CI102_3838 [Trichoderma harzianum]